MGLVAFGRWESGRGKVSMRKDVLCVSTDLVRGAMINASQQ